MAKLTFTINDFSGGVNGYVDPLDIADNELAQCQGFKAESGTVFVLGDMKPVDTTNGSYTIANSIEEASATDIDIEPGYGLFVFSHDYNMAGGGTDLGTNVALSATDYFFMLAVSSGDKHNRIDVFATSDTQWRADMIDLGGSISDNRMGSIKPCFFVADGAVRVSPGNFSQVDSGGDLKDGGDTGDFETETKNPGDFEVVETDANFNTDIAAGDTIIVGKVGADGPGQEMIALITASTALTAAKNMTGLFPSTVTVVSGNDDVYVMPDTRWRGVVARKNFAQAGARGTFTEWYSSYAHPRPPVTYHADLDLGAVATQYTMPFLASASEIDVLFDGTLSPSVAVTYLVGTSNSDATWDGAVINIYCTALYDEAKQESQPNMIKEDLTVPAVQELGLGVMVSYADGSATPADTYLLNKRVTGARVYYEDTTNDPGILFQLLEIDFEKGCKKAEAETFTTWASIVANEVVGCPANDAYNVSELTGANGFIFESPPKAFTYEFNTGYPSDINTHARYKTAVVANRRLFVGNVYQSGKANGDRMISSPINKFDILPEYGDHVIDATVGDGDEIVKLEAYADRILQFKKRTLYIINVGGGLGEEFIESQHRNMGVENPSQTCMTEYGVAWVNAHGVFLYDGQEISDLTREKLQLTNTTTADRPRALNIIESDIPLIGYHPDNKWLIVHVASNISSDFEAEAWIHDFKNGSWTKSAEFSTNAYYKSNMIWTGDNNLVFASGTNAAKPLFVKYRDPVANMSQDKLLLLTKDFNLDAPGVKKKLRSIYITYSAAADSYIEADIIYKHPTGSTTDDLEEAGGGSTYYTEALGLKSTGGTLAAPNIRTVELVPTTYVTNAYTFQLKLHNDDAAYVYTSYFKLYDIAFVYRALGTR